MNLRSKWCLYGLLSWAAMAGIAGAQPPGSVQLGTPSAEQLPPPITSLNDGVGQVSLGEGLGYTKVDRQFRPRFNVDTRGGGLYGYNPGYTNMGMFVPFAIEGDTAILFLDGRGMVTHDGRGGANLGGGWRWWKEDIDRIFGLSAWYDYDNGHRSDYSQIGLSFESLGRYIDYRANGYIPIGTRSHLLSSTVDATDTLFQGNCLAFRRTNVAEQSYTGFDAEMGGPLPVIGRYGVNGYVGGYHFMGNGIASGSFTGVSGRFMAQINEDVSFGVQVTDDHVFGTNTQFQVFVALPDGVPSRWLRNPRVQDRLTQSVYRQGRVMAHTDTYSTFDKAINPKDGLPYFVTHINPNAGPVGNGTFENPFHSIAAYNGQLPIPAAQQKSDIIYVSPRADGTSTNLDTTPTFTLYDGQRLLSTSVAHTFMSTNFPGLIHNLPGFVPDLLPKLVNSAGGDVITLAPGNVQCLEVSGFDIQGSAGGSGISGINNSFVLINRNEIHDSFNGINLVNLTNGISPSVIDSNILRDNISDGFHLLNIGGPSVTTLRLINNTAYGNGDDGFDIAADIGSTVGGLIDGNSTLPPLGATTNGDDGLALSSIGGTLLFNNPLALPVAQQIRNNVFSNNSGDGVFVDVTAGGNADLLFLANTIAGNGGAGIHVPASDASLINLVIGGPDDVLDRNTIANNGGPGILFDLSNTANGLTARIENNLITGNLDGIQVNVADASVFGPGSEIFDNELTANRRDGIRLTRTDTADLNLGAPGTPVIHDNLVNLNGGNGLTLIASDTAAPPVVLATEDNIFDQNVLDGLNIVANNDVVVNFDSNRDQFTGNGQNGLNIISNDQSIIFTNLVNVTANGNGLNGLNTVSNEGDPALPTGQFINISSPTDPLYAGTSTFSNNGGSGISTTANHNSLTVININSLNENQINVDSNGDDGWKLLRTGASLILASATNSTFTDNGSDGIEFTFTGSPPTDPNQPLSGVLGYNQLTLNAVIADANGNNGLSAAGAGDAVLVTNATLSSFSGNAFNGILITTDLGSRFGNPPGVLPPPPTASPGSVFDGITATGNGQDGIHVDENDFLAIGTQVFLEVRTDAANSDISGNFGDGVHVVSNGEETNILLNSTGGNLLTINNNGDNGVRWDVISNGDAFGHNFTIDNVVIDGNANDAVQFNVPTGQGTLTVSNSTLSNSIGDGINVNVTGLNDELTLGQGFAILTATGNIIDHNDGYGVNVQVQGPNNEFLLDPIVRADLVGNQITDSGLSGVNIEIRGASGSRFFPNAFTVDTNLIEGSGRLGVVNESHGIFYQSDPGQIDRFSVGGVFSHRRLQFDDGLPNGNPINPFAPGGPGGLFPDPNYNFSFGSDYLNLTTSVNSTLQVLNNTIQFNGGLVGAPGEGVFLNVGTNSYLSADVNGNTFTGNGSTDFRTRSFLSGPNPPASTDVAAPGNDTLFLDDTAQLDLRFANNTGQSLDPVSAFALYPGEAAKGPGLRYVGLFEVDDFGGTLLNGTNTFTALPFGQTVQSLFNGDFDRLTTTTVFTLNNPAFPENFATDPGDPFLP